MLDAQIAEFNDPVPVTRYDEYLYDEMPVPESHPAHTGAIAWLLGLRVPPVKGCRVLELGCALGGNIIPLAAALPEATFVGLDLSPPQIAVARERAAALGLKNIELIARDIMEVTPDIGTFDYIICHGVYSWVPPPVQRKMLEIYGQCLAPNGLGYISYNTYPGWHLRGGIRDMLRRAVGPHGTPAERVARAREYMAFLSNIPVTGNTTQQWFRAELDVLRQVSDKYVFYEHLVDINLPSYFEEFMADAERCGLAYIGDAHIPSMFSERIGEEAMKAVTARSTTAVESEQSVDLIEIRYFRRTLLCRTEARPDRLVGWPRLDGLRVNSPMAPVSENLDIKSDNNEKFRRTEKAEVETNFPLLKAALKILADERPRGLDFRELCSKSRALLDDAPVQEPTVDDMRTLGQNLAHLCARGHVEPWSWVADFVLKAGPQPVASPVVRQQAELGQTWCTSLKHDTVRMDRFDRCMLRRMDGTRTHDEIVTGIIEDAQAGRVRVELEGVLSQDRELFREIYDKKIEVMARKAVIVS